MNDKISVVLCTYNNASLLSMSLGGLLKQDLDYDFFEVLVIDNNSRDNTREVVDSYLDEAFDLKYFLETNQGLSIARNRGIAESSYDLIAFTDDDAEPASNWLRQMRKTFRQNQDAWVVGGRAFGVWEKKPPHWLTQDMYPSLSLKDYGDELKRLEWPERVIGVNFAFRKKVFQEVGLFDTALGRKGKSLAGSEDTEIQERVHKLGRSVIYDPALNVGHWVPESRMKLSYFARRMQGAAETAGMMDASNASLLFNYFISCRTILLSVPFSLIRLVCLLIFQRHWKGLLPLAYHAAYIRQTIRLTFSREQIERNEKT